MKKELNTMINKFNDLMEYVKTDDRTTIEYTRGYKTEFEEVTFNFLDDTYVLHRSSTEAKDYYDLVYIQFCPYKRMDLELTYYPSLNEFNIEEKWDTQNKIESEEVDSNKFLNGIEKFKHNFEQC